MNNKIKGGYAMKRMSFTLISLLLLCSILLNTAGCAMKVRATDLMDGVTPRKMNESVDLLGKNTDVTDFAIRLFKSTSEGEQNTLISPLSVLCALAMTANGAKGETREQMESVLGMSAEELNVYLYAYMSALSQDKKYQLHIANSVWFAENRNFSVNQQFLQMNADYYGADIYETSFDKRTLKDIHRWVKNATDGMIPEILDRISDNAVM